jgi:two-component system sensor histidine kinase and response regulator WspE
MSSLTQYPPVDPVMLDLFRTELETRTRVLEEGLVKAEAVQSPKLLEPLMRAAHSIKGAARMIGLDRAVRLAHAMEDVLSAAQRGALKLSSAHVEALLHSNDVFLHAATAAPAAIPSEFEKQSATIDRLIVELTQSLTGPTPPPAPKPSPAPAVAVDAPMLDMFRAELETHSRALKEGLAKPGAQSAETLQALSRAAHSIKGAARMVGMYPAVRLAGAIEESLVAAQHGTGALTSAQTDLLSQANDILLRAAALAPGTIALELERQSAAIDQFIAGMPAAPAAPSTSPAPARQEAAPSSPPHPKTSPCESAPNP